MFPRLRNAVSDAVASWPSRQIRAPNVSPIFLPLRIQPALLLIRCFAPPRLRHSEVGPTAQFVAQLAQKVDTSSASHSASPGPSSGVLFSSHAEFHNGLALVRGHNRAGTPVASSFEYPLMTRARDERSSVGQTKRFLPALPAREYPSCQSKTPGRGSASFQNDPGTGSCYLSWPRRGSLSNERPSPLLTSVGPRGSTSIGAPR